MNDAPEIAEDIKAALCRLMDEVCDERRTGIRLDAYRYAHAKACMREAVDELFYECETLERG